MIDRSHLTRGLVAGGLAAGGLATGAYYNRHGLNSFVEAYRKYPQLALGAAALGTGAASLYMGKNWLFPKEIPPFTRQFRVTLQDPDAENRRVVISVNSANNGNVLYEKVRRHFGIPSDDFEFNLIDEKTKTKVEKNIELGNQTKLGEELTIDFQPYFKKMNWIWRYLQKVLTLEPVDVVQLIDEMERDMKEVESFKSDEYNTSTQSLLEAIIRAASAKNSQGAQIFILTGTQNGISVQRARVVPGSAWIAGA